jgi:hypothetical protein
MASPWLFLGGAKAIQAMSWQRYVMFCYLLIMQVYIGLVPQQRGG